jgi:hypothetical protein
VLTRKSKNPEALHLRVGEIVEIRGREEILRTLDEKGRLDALPFMPEMLKFCGQRFHVFKRADKICDTIEKTGFRQLKNTVLLEGLRCDGQAHGGCQARCLMLWKEAWLRRASPAKKEKWKSAISITSEEVGKHASSPSNPNECTEVALLKATRKQIDSQDPCDETFICQVTELSNATLPLAWWDARQYIRDIWSGNVAVWDWIRGILIILFNAVQQMRNGVSYPHMQSGKLTKTPNEKLNLQCGEVVEVKTREEIYQTLDMNSKNRGLWFDVEMLKFCRGRFQVLGHVQKIIDERTGKMRNFTNDCIILDGVTCNGDYHRFCPRSEYIYWRETWLRRIV